MPAFAKQNSPVDDGYIPFSVRFKAWWEGLDPNALVAKPSDNDDPGNPLAIQVDEPEEANNWPTSRLDFCRRLWEVEEEDEVVEPGGAAYTSWLMKPMSLTSEMSAADLSAGLGGGTRRAAKDLSCYIDGFEPDLDLAMLGHGLSKKHGMERRVPIITYDPDKMNLPEQRYHGILCRERLFRMPNKPKALQAIYSGLKPRGHLIITDFVLGENAELDDREIAAWVAKEPGAKHLWTEAQYRKTIVGMGMDLRVDQDETDMFRSKLLQAWAQLVAGLSRSDLTRDFVNVMMREAEYWLLLVRALESKKLRYFRFHADRSAVVR
ncbi:MAG: hypothetical protein RIM33_13575 [Alphaproteobacteria bacterium]